MHSIFIPTSSLVSDKTWIIGKIYVIAPIKHNVIWFWSLIWAIFKTVQAGSLKNGCIYLHSQWVLETYLRTVA